MNTNEKAIRLNEICELSTENSKTYAMSDGSKQTVFTVSKTETANEGIMTLSAVEAEPSTSMETYSWVDSTLSNASEHTVGMTGTTGVLKANRMYLKLTVPTLPRNPRIKKAKLVLTQKSITGTDTPAIGLYTVADKLSVGTLNNTLDIPPLDYEVMRTSTDTVKYTFDITNLVDEAYRTSVTSVNLAVKLIKESLTAATNVVLYGATSTTDKPEICITYESSYGVNTSYRTNNHNLGKFGEATVDLACGNLMFESTDFAWAGSRMPVTIKRLYNSALSDKQYTADSSIGLNAADYSAMKLGYGWRLNLMQSMVSATVYHEGTAHDGYIYIDEQGNETRFIPEKDKNNVLTGKFISADDEDIKYDPDNTTLTMGDTYYTFADGRLAEIKDSHNNTNTITYTEGRITKVTDGVGREFVFAYDDNGYLTSITAPDGSVITYYYSDGYLSSIIYPDKSRASVKYQGDKVRQVILLNSSVKEVFRMTYTFTNGRLNKHVEHGVEDGEYVIGTSTSFDYSASAGRTTVTVTEPADTSEGETADTVTKTVYTIDDNGEIISEYTYSDNLDSTGITNGSMESHIPYTENLLLNHGFNGITSWNPIEENLEGFYYGKFTDIKNKYGKYACTLGSYTDTAVANGIYQTTDILPAGEYTFSGYVYVNKELSSGDNFCTYLQVTDTDNNILCETEHIVETPDGYVRLIAPFTLTADKAVKVRALVDGICVTYLNAPQLENKGFATTYNMLSNSGFERGTESWELKSYAAVTTDNNFNGNRALKLTGDIDKQGCAYQTVNVKPRRGTRETFTLSGWAKAANALSDRDRDSVDNAPIFRLRATFKYADGAEDEYHVADFSPCTDEWQYVSLQFSKEYYGSVDELRISCDYMYNTGEAYFDNIQLVCDSVEFDLIESDFKDVSLIEEKIEEISEIVENNYTAPEFEELIDEFGNTVTETTFTDGEFGTIYRSSTYDSDGNNLIIETDARGNTTTYTVDPDTSRNTTVTDRCGNKTAYEYDKTSKTTKVTSKDSADAELANVSYVYDTFDNMTEIVRGDGMKYVLGYNAFHELESIKVDGMNTSLITYDYKNGNGRLKSMTYANGDKMKATYNSLGQMTAETWYGTDENGNTVMTAKYKYIYDNNGNIVRTIDILSLKEYNYIYEDNRLIKALEYNITLSDNEIVTAKVVKNTVFYIYDTDSNMTRKVIQPAYGDKQTIYYQYPENGNTVVKFNIPRSDGDDDLTVTSHSKTDSFGRKVFDEIQHGLGVTSRHFSYYNGEVTEEHAEAEKYKSAPTTQLIKEIVISSTNQYEADRVLSYEYDNEERITKVTDTLDGVTEYTYDALGQLLTETVNGSVVNSMTYDSYGNILTKNGKVYTYDTVWKDKLTSYNGQAIEYDEQGNPTSYFGHTLEWEKGRQLKKCGDFTYTYNANGIRTSKTKYGIKHTYTLEGTKILREEWGSNTLIPLYDNEDSVCGIRFNQFTYFFVKNLQGDVIAITNPTGATLVRYSYDAWGRCTTDLIDPTGNGIHSINPFRYRGYYYDSETGLYYLQSRYYDPITGRFVNGDETTYLGAGKITSYALYTYCENDCINYVDYFGHTPSLSTLTKMHNAVLASSIGQLLGFGIIAFPEVRTCDLDGQYIGRMDIYSFITNQVWEVKRNNDLGIAEGFRQLYTYVNSYVYSLYHCWYSIRIMPKYGRSSVFGAILVSGYLVTYHSYSKFNSLIVYDYFSLKEAAETLLSLVTSSFAIMTSLLSIFSLEMRKKLVGVISDLMVIMRKCKQTTEAIIKSFCDYIKKATPIILILLALLILITIGLGVFVLI